MLLLLRQPVPGCVKGFMCGAGECREEQVGIQGRHVLDHVLLLLLQGLSAPGAYVPATPKPGTLLRNRETGGSITLLHICNVLGTPSVRVHARSMEFDGVNATRVVLKVIYRFLR